ncbi:heterokaryon incompatibility protein-domain-containing protein [Ilyonectria sp. MPI-CAGE-AT-0026]|nr:heterokaryon incompatibility protein-domain-containing protein [Ilyonectria sp. MPI-CAGE-AT-0026]
MGLHVSSLLDRLDHSKGLKSNPADLQFDKVSETERRQSDGLNYADLEDDLDGDAYGNYYPSLEGDGPTSPWRHNLEALLDWFKYSEDDQHHLTYGHEISTGPAQSLPERIDLKRTLDWPTSPAPSNSTPPEKRQSTSTVNLGFQEASLVIDESEHGLPILPSPQMPRLEKQTPTQQMIPEVKHHEIQGNGLKTLFSVRESHIHFKTWASIIPEGAHSCSHCRRLLINATELEPKAEHKSHFFTLSDVKEAAESHCTVFKWLQNCTPMLKLSNGDGRYFSLSLIHRQPESRDISSIILESGTPDNLGSEYHGSLGVFVSRDVPAADYISGRPLNIDVASDENFELSRKWLGECHRNHAECRGSNRAYMPARVLEIKGSKVKLIQTQGDQAGKYAALSYCWGGSQGCMLTSETLPTLIQDIPTHQLALTIQDAIEVTRKLKLRYLWVDVVCIIQDDIADQRREIPRMSEIFEAAYVTISAASARSCREGFLAPRHPELATIPYILPDGELGALTLYQDIDAADEPIQSRAWTLQEHVNASRILEFGTQQLRRTCRVMPQSFDLKEWRKLAPPTSGGTIGKDISDLWKKPENILYRCWQPLVKNYTRRHLHNPSDKPLAIYGIAMEYKKMLRSEYKAGLWLNFLKQDLLWKRDESTSGKPRRLDNRCPSWSWLSVDSAVIVWEAPRNWTFETLEVLDCSVNEHLWYEEDLSDPLKGDDLWLSFLELIGCTREAVWIVKEGLLVADEHNKDRPFANVVADVPGEDPILNEEISVVCLEIAKGVAGLVLVRSNKPGLDNRFQRVGLWTIRDTTSYEEKEAQGNWLETGKQSNLCLL